MHDRRATKSRIIPPDWKPTIDALLSKELVSANRYFAQANPDLAELVQQEALKAPLEFLDTLRSRWAWHHAFYEDILEPAIPALLHGAHDEIPPSRIIAIQQAYQASSLVDQATLVPSAAIKKHAARWLNHLQQKGQFTDEEKALMYCIPRESFWIRYHRDHLTYALAIANHDCRTAAQCKQTLMRIYHASDEAIFAGRWKRFARAAAQDPQALEKEIAALTLPASESIKHGYLTLERPWLKALSEILIIDNCDEYETLYTLKGISGFVLRKKILRALDDAGILPNDGGIYAFPDATVISSLDTLAHSRETSMRKRVRPYRQTDMTCGAVCLMMATHHHGQEDCSLRAERRIHHATQSRHVPGNHFSALAVEAAHRGLEARLLHSEPALFSPDRGLFPPDLFRKLMDEYHAFAAHAAQHQVTITSGDPLTAQTVVQLLKEDHLVIIAGMCDGILHAQLATGYEQNGIALIDPLTGRETLSPPACVDAFMGTPIGRWALAVRNPTSPLQILLSQIPAYRTQAQAYLTTNRR